jgi:hypothetical protein
MFRRSPLLHVLLVLSLVLNGPTVAFASASMAAAALEAAAGEHAPDCHEHAGAEDAPSSFGFSMSDCCDQGACLCMGAASAVAAVDGVCGREIPPEHSASSGALTQGHSFPAPNPLLRPPIA